MHNTLPPDLLDEAGLERYGAALASASYSALLNHRDALVAQSLAGDALARQLLSTVVDAVHRRPEEAAAATRRAAAVAEGAAQWQRRRRAGSGLIVELRNLGRRRRPAVPFHVDPPSAHRVFADHVRRLADGTTTDARLVLKEDR